MYQLLKGPYSYFTYAFDFYLKKHLLYECQLEN